MPLLARLAAVIPCLVTKMAQPFVRPLRMALGALKATNMEAAKKFAYF
jgi:hypothetical protein